MYSHSQNWHLGHCNRQYYFIEWLEITSQCSLITKIQLLYSILKKHNAFHLLDTYENFEIIHHLLACAKELFSDKHMSSPMICYT